MFYPAFKTKVDDFFEMMNIDKDSDNSFFRRFTVQITSKQLDAPFPEIENDIGNTLRMTLKYLRTS